MNTSKHLTPPLPGGFETLAGAHGIRFIVVFGSYAQGQAEEESDVDVAVFLTPPRSLFRDYRGYARLLEELGELLGVDPARIDLADLGRANILFRYEITSKGRLLFGDEEAYAQYQAFAFRDYLDAGTLFRLEDYIIRKRQKLLADSH
jgi:predicted nucleotidyltransferase